MAEGGQALGVTLCPGHTAVEEERAEVRGVCLSSLPLPGQANPGTEGPGGLDRPAGLGSKASSGHRAWGCWHTKLVWLPQVDLVAVRQAAARRARQVGTRHQGGRQGCGPASGSRSCSGLGEGAIPGLLRDSAPQSPQRLSEQDKAFSSWGIEEGGTGQPGIGGIHSSASTSLVP